MIFQNMMELKLADVRQVVKVGDTVSDIAEGNAAGVWSVGVIDGSSVMGLDKENFEGLTEYEKDERRDVVRQVFLQAGADFVITDMTELPVVIQKIQQTNG
jgi:phosphonoacetaldehyde hydrolase